METEMTKIEVFFDYTEVGTDIELGAVVVDEGEVVHSKLELKKDGKTKGNQYHYGIMAWATGMRAVKEFLREEDVFDQVVFKNQNQMIFDWAEKGNYKSPYNSVMERLYKEVSEVMKEFEVKFSYKKVAGKDNVAKKMMKKRKQKKEERVERELNFGKVLDKGSKKEKKESVETGDNVVNMFKESKEA